jgi:hypothetical protein
MGVRLVVSLLVLPLLLAGCGEDSTNVAHESGSLAALSTRSLECDGPPYGTHGADYDDGLNEVQDNSTDALDNWLDAEAWATGLPTEGYDVEWERDGQALLSWDVGGRTRVAVIADDDVRDYNDDVGWGVRSWARCDPAELPSETTDQLGIGVWEDSSGARVPTTEVVSFQGAEHCDWQDTTWLRLGVASDQDRRYDEYLSGDDGGELAAYLTTSVDHSARLPDDAVDTGWRRDGRKLWIGESPRAAYLVSVDDTSDVELWPATKKPVGCA